MSNNQILRVQEELSKLKSQGLATSHRTKFNESGMYFEMCVYRAFIHL